MKKKNLVFLEDLENIYNNHQNKKLFRNKKVLITGCAGFLGYYLSNYLSKYFEKLGIKKLYLTSLNIKNFKNEFKNKNIEVKKFDVINDKLEKIDKNLNIIIHAASIASPLFYRKNPLQTIESNVKGLWNILNYCKKKKYNTNILFFSSSEVYGDANPKNIPTKETYFGNVNPVGPRACYDESKRFCETLCYEYSKKYKKMFISVVRPFNNFGPGMNINDARLPADLAKSTVKKENFKIFSDGEPKRTFCYISDATIGYINSLNIKKFEILNIGSTKEITIKEFALLFQKAALKVFKFKPKIIFKIHKDKNYLKDNPNRRCPDLKKAKKLINYKPKVSTMSGIIRYLKFLKNENEY